VQKLFLRQIWSVLQDGLTYLELCGHGEKKGSPKQGYENVFNSEHGKDDSNIFLRVLKLNDTMFFIVT
jgi:hypothetical protein